MGLKLRFGNGKRGQGRVLVPSGGSIVVMVMGMIVKGKLAGKVVVGTAYRHMRSNG